MLKLKLNDIDRIKRPQAIQTLVEKEAIKNYLPLAITAAVKEYAMIELGLGASAQELKRKEVMNIKYKVRGPMEVHLVGNSDLNANFDFCVKKVLAYGVEKDIIKEIHKFPLPFQYLLIKEACAVMDRLEKGKGIPGLTSLDCRCSFCNQYLLLCKHIFHEHLYGNVKLLTTDVWRMFQNIFEESGYEVYEHRELVIEFVQTE
ncbi:hypothetical protein C1645_738467 [Glomus cerebriforme]|uniref:SWIM-type domain-containing protein n=1 Tax=Glomus cerebriforme TaxID=658196 RepID=A0A397SXB5_9GLOM|nr:hypothetical protein C1645_738467 [Glomus cerebriforme]